MDRLHVVAIHRPLPEQIARTRPRDLRRPSVSEAKRGGSPPPLTVRKGGEEKPRPTTRPGPRRCLRAWHRALALRVTAVTATSAAHLVGLGRFNALSVSVHWRFRSLVAPAPSGELLPTISPSRDRTPDLSSNDGFFCRGPLLATASGSSQEADTASDASAHPDGYGSDEQIFEGYGSAGQMFGAKQQVPHEGKSDQEAKPPATGCSILKRENKNENASFINCGCACARRHG